MQIPSLAHKTRFGRMYSRSLKDIPQHPSITTIISQEQSLGLYRWFSYMSANYILNDFSFKKAIFNQQKSLNPKFISNLLYRASNAATSFSNAAAQRGNRVHYYCEQATLKRMGKNHKIDEARERLNNKGEINFANSFDEWWNSCNIDPLLTEITVWNDTLGYAGTLDLVARINGKICLIDFKTKGTDKKGKIKKIDDKIAMQLIAGMKAQEALKNPITGEWIKWEYGDKIGCKNSTFKFPNNQEPLLFGIAIGEKEFQIMQVNPNIQEKYWKKFCTLLELWKNTYQIHHSSISGEKTLIPIKNMIF